MRDQTAKDQLDDYIEVFYDQQRRHSTLDYIRESIAPTIAFVAASAAVAAASCGSLPPMAAMAHAEVGDDVFGDDPTVNALQDRVADLLGKEVAL